MNRMFVFFLLLLLCYSASAQRKGLMPSSTPIMNPPLSYEDSIANVGKGDLKMLIENYYNDYKIFKWGTKNQSLCTIDYILLDDGNQIDFFSLDSLSKIKIGKVIGFEVITDDSRAAVLGGSRGQECGIMKLNINRKED